MNRTKIDFADFSWNPFCGCSNGCEWCYARKMAKRVGAIIGCEKCSRFEFHFHPERMDAPLKVKKPSIVFLGSMCDLFCDAAKDFVVEGDCGRFSGKYKTPAVFVQQWVTIASQHQYVVLTKRPENIPQGWNDDVPNLWVGVSMTCKNDGKDFAKRADLCERILNRRILCVEPLLGFPRYYHCREYQTGIEDLHLVNWLIVGGLTGHGKQRPHCFDWVKLLVNDARMAGLPVFLKRNLAPEVPMEYIMEHRDYPPELAAVKGKEKV